jgi:rubrerythrin
MSDTTRSAVATHVPVLMTGRRALLKWSGVAAVSSLTLGGMLPGLDVVKAFGETGPATSNKVDLGEGDVGILNYAYALEQLEAAFYTQVAKTPYSNMESKDRVILTAIRDHEIAHRDFLKAALKKNAIPELEVDFSKIDFDNRDNVLTTALTFENLGVGAYNGAGQFLKKAEYLLVAGKIVSVEARHAAAIRYLLTSTVQTNADAHAPEMVVNDKGLDQELAPSAVLSKAGPFVKTPITAEHVG